MHVDLKGLFLTSFMLNFMNIVGTTSFASDLFPLHQSILPAGRVVIRLISCQADSPRSQY